MQEKDVMKLVSDFQKMRVMMQQMSQGMLPGMGMPGMGMPGMGMPGMMDPNSPLFQAAIQAVIIA